MEDCVIYDQADPYKYVRLTACDEQDDYLVVGGCDHKVGQEQENGRFTELEQWTRDRFTKASTGMSFRSTLFSTQISSYTSTLTLFWQY